MTSDSLPNPAERSKQCADSDDDFRDGGGRVETSDDLKRATTAGAARHVNPVGGTTRRVVFWFVTSTAVLYAPLALTYMWFAFDADAPRVQEAVTSALDGPTYVTGAGSVRAVRTIDYVDHRLVMVVHTTLGAAALVLAMFQYSTKPRKRPRLHRRIGRTYMGLMTISMSSALAFLARTSAVAYPGQSAFRLQLWVLAVSTLGSGWIAFAAARRGHLRAHHAWMAMNTSFMMTAPLLRMLWTALGKVLPHHTMLTNMNTSAVVLAVVAPAAGSLAVVSCDRPARRHGRLGGGPIHFALGAAVPLLGVSVVTASYDTLKATAALPPSFPWFFTIPAISYWAVCAVGALRARWRSDIGLERSWRMLMIGAALAPWSALVVGAAARVTMGATEGYIAGLMVGPGTPIVAVFALLTLDARQRTENAALQRS